MAEYGPVPEEQRARYHDLRHYAFDPETGERDYSEGFPPELAARRGLFEDGDLRCICSYQPFTAAVRDEWLPMGGIASVATPPEHRRRGHVRRLLAEVLAEFRERDIPLSALYPFSYAFFRRHGWALAERTRRYECAPGTLSSVAEPRGAFFRAGADDWAALDAAFERHVSGYDLATRRDEAWWRAHVFELRRDTPYVYAWERDGDVRGYLSYAVSATREGWSPADDITNKPRRLDAYEFVYADPEARGQLLRFLYHHDSQFDRVSFATPAPAGLLDRVADPRAVECAVEPGAMVRLVDVPAAVEAIPYPEDAAGRVTIGVDDPLVGWNDGTFAVELADGEAACAPVSEEPDVRLGVGVLSQIYAGYRSPREAAEAGSLTVEDPDGTAVLDAAFPKRDTYLPEKF